MSSAVEQTLSGKSETCLTPLCWRDVESQHPDTMIKDKKALMLDGPLFRLFKPIRSFQFWLEKARKFLGIYHVHKIEFHFESFR